nr:MAG TPA: hypothetical protein [Bacteriophage sp.]
MERRRTGQGRLHGNMLPSIIGGATHPATMAM